MILGAYSHHKEGEPIRSLIGAGNGYAKVRSWWDASELVSLDANYFQNKLGGLGQYYLTAMQAMGIIGINERPSWVFPLTHRGENLANAYGDSIAKSSYAKKLEEDGQLDELSHKDATSYGKVGCICQEALAQGRDLPLLRDAFFRFDQTKEDNPHVRRRLALAVTLDLVRGAKGKFERYMVRPALYLGEFAAKSTYQPSPKLEDWVFRWKMVAVRHHYTFGLQALWGSFILQLRAQTNGIALSDFMSWIKKTLGTNKFDASLGNYLDNCCESVGLSGSWQKSHVDFAKACLQSSELDEYSLFLQANQNPTDSDLLLRVGVQTLAHHYLRFLNLHQNPRPEWREMAKRERLPISSFYKFMEDNLAANASLGQSLELLYKEFLLGQHEFIALGKLRFQNYDTFKFYYRDGKFYWPFTRPDYWQEPIRLAGNRLSNALSIVSDLGLVTEKESRFSLTEDGKNFLARSIEMRNHGN